MNQLKCEQCGATGAIEIDGSDQLCTACDGAGIIPSVEPEECWMCEQCEGTGQKDTPMTEHWKPCDEYEQLRAAIAKARGL